MICLGALNLARRPLSAERIRQFAQRRAGMCDDRCCHGFTEVGMRQAENSAFQHALDRVDLGLDLFGYTLKPPKITRSLAGPTMWM